MIYCLNLSHSYVRNKISSDLKNSFLKEIEMKIIHFLQKVHQSLFVQKDHPNRMDLAIQRVTQKQQIQNQLILFKTDYLE
jgi:hypothetical protein